MVQFDSFIRSRFKPRYLQLLIALDDFRHVGKVAASINVTQPAVSKTLAELERGLGLKLFERTARGMQPTVYGECLIRHARVMLGDLSQTRDELRGLVAGSSGSVRVGVLMTAALDLLPRSIALLKKRQPGVTVLAREGSMETLMPELMLGHLDIIVGRLPDRRTADGLGEKTLMEEAVNLVVGPHHPLARRPRLRWSDLGGYPWVIPPVNTLLREPLERAFERHGLSMPVNRVETLSVHVIQGYLNETDAIAALAVDVSKYYRSLGLLSILPLSMPRLVRPVGAMWSRQRALAPGAQSLIQCLEEVAGPRRAVTGAAKLVPRPGARASAPRAARASREEAKPKRISVS